ncbi:OmpP1/FadL family transporter [Thermodesulfobacteriota bacterium]
MKKLLITAAALGLTIGFVATASATNGYFSHAYSIKSKGMAGAGVAAPLDAMAPASNPAGLTEVGDRLDVGLSIFNPNREYNVAGDPFTMSDPNDFGLALGTVESDSEFFFIPNIGWSKQLNDKSAIGIAMYGNGGMNTDYSPNPITGNTFYDPISDNTGVDLMQLFIAPTYAHKLSEKHSLGITPIIGVQFFEARGLLAFSPYSSDPANLTNKGHDTSFGFGARVGYLGKITDQFNIGLSYQSKIYMDELDDYAGLFAEQGDFDIPANWTIGLAFMPTPTVTLALDVQQIYYSDVNSIANSMLATLAPGSLGTDNGPGFGWDDMTIVKLGLQWARTEKWTYRFGYSYGEQPISASSANPLDNDIIFNILAPGVIEQHASFGLTYTFANKSELDFSLTYALEKDVTGPNFMDQTDAQIVTLTMNQWEVGIGYSWKF